MPIKSSISVSQIKEGLETQLFGSEILGFDEVESTNDLAKRCLDKGEGLVIITDSQTKGKGRSGRTWHSPKGLGIYLSALIKPQTANPSPLTLMAGVACVSAIKPFLTEEGPNPSLKWPNDILIQGKKLAGILCELCDGKSGWLVIGIGINVNHLPSDFPDSLQEIATSLKMEGGGPVDKAALIRSLIIQLDREYRSWQLEGTPALVKRWSEHTRMFGKQINVNRGGSNFHGTAKRLDEEGQLVVLTKNGEEMAFASGEVTLNP